MMQRRALTLMIVILTILSAGFAAQEKEKNMPEVRLTVPKTAHAHGVALPVLASYPAGFLQDRNIEAGVWHNGARLFFKFEIPLAESYQPELKTGRDNSYWETDSVEIFLKPKKTGELFHIIAGMSGDFYDDSRSLKKAWNGDVQTLSKREGDVWALQVSLPLSDMGLESGDLPAEVAFQVAVNIKSPNDTYSVTTVPCMTRAYAENLGTLLLAENDAIWLQDFVLEYEREGEQTVLMGYATIHNRGDDIRIKTNAGEALLRKGHSTPVKMPSVIEGESGWYRGHAGDIVAYAVQAENPFLLNLDMYRYGEKDIRFRLPAPEKAMQRADAVSIEIAGKRWGPVALNALDVFAIDVAEVPIGDLVAKFEFTKEGEAVVEVEKPFRRINEEPIDFDLRDFDVSKYYAPIQVADRKAKVARSEYDFTGSALPAGITLDTAACKVGAVEILVDGKPAQIDTGAFTETHKNFVSVEGAAHGASVDFELEGRLDYDGLFWQEMAAQLENREARKMALRIPITFSSDAIFLNYARLYRNDLISEKPFGMSSDHKRNGGWTLEIPEGETKMPLTAAISVVTDAGGLCFYPPIRPGLLELENYDDMLLIERKGREVAIILKLADGKAPFPGDTLKANFGIQPVPVRTLSDDYNLGEVRKVMRTYYDINTVRHFAELGTQIYEIMRWTEMFSYHDSIEHDERNVELVDLVHKLGMKMVFYIGFEISTLAPEAPLYLENTIVRPFGNVWTPTPGEQTYYVCHGSVYGDHHVRGVDRMIEKYDLQGIYMDGTLNPHACGSDYHGHAVTDSRGRITPTMTTLDKRRMSQLLYKIGLKHDLNFLHDMHASSGLWPATMGLVDTLWNGEQTKLITGEWKLPLYALRAQLNSRTYGIPIELLSYGWGEPELANGEALLFDTMLRAQYPKKDEPGDWTTPIWKGWNFFEKYDLRRQYFTGFWEKDAAIRDLTGKALVSYYETPTHLIIVAANLEYEKQIVVQLDFGPLGKKVKPLAVEEIYGRGNKFTLADGRLDLEIPKRDFRMLVFEKK